MRRLPNPWIAIPAVLAAIGGFIVGYFVMDASCAPDSCTVAAASIGLLAGIVAAVGVGVVVVLTLRSFAEWREHADRDVLTEVDPED